MSRITSKDFTYSVISERLKRVPPESKIAELNCILEDFSFIETLSSLNLAKENFLDALANLYRSDLISEAVYQNVVGKISDIYLRHPAVTADEEYLKEVSNFKVWHILNTFEGIRNRSNYATSQSILNKYSLELVFEARELCEDFLKRYSKQSIYDWCLELAAKTYNEKVKSGMDTGDALDLAFRHMQIIFTKNILPESKIPVVKKAIMNKAGDV